jgi:hypothetical protein
MLRIKSVILSASFIFATALTPIMAHAASDAGVAKQAQSSAKRVLTTGGCPLTRMNFAASTLDGSGTTSTSFVDVPEASLTFFQGGTLSNCVIVNFSAMSFASTASTALVLVRAVLDGVVVAIPPETQFSGDDDEDADFRWSRSHDYNFVFPRVAPGSHTVTMQFRSSDGGQVFINRHTMVVYHR